jgi:hypothetical protein
MPEVSMLIGSLWGRTFVVARCSSLRKNRNFRTNVRYLKYYDVYPRAYAFAMIQVQGNTHLHNNPRNTL